LPFPADAPKIAADSGVIALLPIVPIPMRTFPNLHRLDVHAQKTVRLASHTLTVRLDISNTLNIKHGHVGTHQSGATFGRRALCRDITCRSGSPIRSDGRTGDAGGL
jgi:hypothetical protein